jgi:hypothetical protein
MAGTDQEIRPDDREGRKGLSWTEFDTLVEDLMAQLADAGRTDASAGEAKRPGTAGGPLVAAPRRSDPVGRDRPGRALPAETPPAVQPRETPARPDPTAGFEDAFEAGLQDDLDFADEAEEEGEPAAPAARGDAIRRLLEEFRQSACDLPQRPAVQAAALCGTVAAAALGFYFVAPTFAERGAEATSAAVRTASLFAAPAHMTVAKTDRDAEPPVPRPVKTIRITEEAPDAGGSGAAPAASRDAERLNTGSADGMAEALFSGTQTMAGGTDVPVTEEAASGAMNEAAPGSDGERPAAGETVVAAVQPANLPVESDPGADAGPAGGADMAVAPEGEGDIEEGPIEDASATGGEASTAAEAPSSESGTQVYNSWEPRPRPLVSADAQPLPRAAPPRRGG